LGASFNSAASNFRLDGNANFSKQKKRKKIVKSQQEKQKTKNIRQITTGKNRNKTANISNIKILNLLLILLPQFLLKLIF
jgi:hypothetical protein